MRTIVLLLLAFLLSSCGVQYHLKKSQKHYNKAIVKGYKPKADTTRITTTLQPIQLTTDTVKQTQVLKGIDRILIDKIPQAPQGVKRIILKQIDSVLIKNKAFLNYDSIHTLSTGTQVHAQIKDGVLKLSVVEAQTKERIYIKDNYIKYLPHLIILLAVIIIFWKLRKKQA